MAGVHQADDLSSADQVSPDRVVSDFVSGRAEVVIKSWFGDMGLSVTKHKGSCASGTESQTLTVGVPCKVRVYCRAPSKGVGEKPQIHSNLVVEFGVFKGEEKRS